MADGWLLIHSPIVGADTWYPVAQRLRDVGDVVAVPQVTMGTAAPFAARHVVAACDVALPPGSRPVVVAHSGSGPLIAAIGARLTASGRPPSAYVLADAGVPSTDGASRLDQLRAEAPELADHLEDTLPAGGRFPDWDDAQLSALVPDAERRRRLIAGLQPAPLGYWREPLPTTPGWPDAPGGVLLFSDGYERTAAWASGIDWPIHRLDDANHFLPLADSQRVTVALQELGDALVTAARGG